jgi:hypothetical protein
MTNTDLTKAFCEKYDEFCQELNLKEKFLGTKPPHYTPEFQAAMTKAREYVPTFFPEMNVLYSMKVTVVDTKDGFEFWRPELTSTVVDSSYVEMIRHRQRDAKRLDEEFIEYLNKDKLEQGTIQTIRVPFLLIRYLPNVIYELWYVNKFY